MPADPHSHGAIHARGRGAPGTGPTLVIERRTRAIGRFAFEIERQAGAPWTPIEHAQARAVADMLEGWAERREQCQPDPRGGRHVRPIDRRARGPHARARRRDHARRVRLLAGAHCGAGRGAALTEARRVPSGGRRGRPPAERATRAFLLPQTTATQAPAVTRRLKADLARAAAAAGIAIVAEGFATRMPGQEAGGSLLHEARSRIDDSGPIRA